MIRFIYLFIYFNNIILIIMLLFTGIIIIHGFESLKYCYVL